jgi:prepilin-type N-terminal cleavage/methylation domain-containing protein
LKKGFTLIELLVSLTILSLFLGSFFHILSAEVRASKYLTQASAQSQVSSHLFKRIGSDIRAANKILSTSNPSRLCLQVENDIIEYFLSGGELKRRKNNSSSPLSNQGDLKSLSFSFSDKLIEIKIDQRSLTVALRN